MKIVKTIKDESLDIVIYTVKLKKNLFAEVIEREAKNMIYVAALTDRNGDLVADPADENEIINFVKNNKPAEAKTEN